MGSFAASLKTIGDRDGLPATVSVHDGRLSIAAGGDSIGDWALRDIRLEPIPNGYRLAAEGEQIIIEMKDSDLFASEISKRSRRNLSISVPSRDVLLRPVDRSLVAAEKRWGALLPQWVFTRMMLAAVTIALVLMIVFPGAVSTFLLVAGLLIVVFGAVVYTDSMLASRWLPGRMAPMHALLFGVAIVIFGVLLGVLAR
jgi:hypothetical protein